VSLAKVLVVVESPAKAKTIGKFLDKKYMVKASMGHVRDLPKSQFGVELDNNLNVKYITIRGKGELIQELKSLAQKSDKVYLATDPDREGEAIAWHLQELLKIPGEENCRIEFNEITKKAITEAVKKPRKIDRDLVDAQQARRVLDRIVGYKLSPLLWRKIRKGLSAGRVQSVAVRMICDREAEINAFVPEEYWTLTARLTKDQTIFEARLHKIGDEKAELKDKESTSKVIAEIGKEKFLVVGIKKRQQKRNPPPPFTTSSLQQEAYRKLGYTAKKTMMIAQQLYEGLDLSKSEGTVGLVTYIRTDSTRVSAEAQGEAREYLLANFGKEYLPDKARVFASKGRTQNAHECIRPTSAARSPESLKQYLKPDQYKLYKLIWERFLASQMASAVFDVTTVDLKVKKYIFRASGTYLVFAGYTKLYTESKDGPENEEQGSLPELQENEEIILQKLLPKQHFTQPPPRYTEASLIKTLEENGIGRPSTYAPIVETIISRGYVTRVQKQFSPTELGCLVVDLLKKYFKEIIDTEFTANMENKLDEVEEGNLDWKEIIKNFYEPFSKELEFADEDIGQIEIADEVSDEICENCGRNMVIKTGRFGKFLACPGFPQCRNTKPILQETGKACPKCGEGKIILRSTRKGRKFYGCSSYPQCDFVSWNEPTGEKCPVCEGFLGVKAKDMFIPSSHFFYDYIVIRINTDRCSNFHGSFGDFTRRKLGMANQCPCSRKSVGASGTYGGYPVIRLDYFPGSGDYQEVRLISHYQHGLEVSQHPIHAPGFGQFYYSSCQVAVMFLQFFLKSFKESKSISHRTGKTSYNPSLINLSYLSGPMFHDDILTQSNLPVSGHGHSISFFHANNRGSPDHIITSLL
jgi:DNA topoisomerase-1